MVGHPTTSLLMPATAAVALLQLVAFSAASGRTLQQTPVFSCNSTSYYAFDTAPAAWMPKVVAKGLPDATSNPPVLGCLTFGFNLTVQDTIDNSTGGTITLSASYTGNYVADIPIPCSVPDVQGWLDTHRVQLQKGLRAVHHKPWSTATPFGANQLCADSLAECPDLALQADFCTSANGTANCTESCSACTKLGFDWQLQSSLASIELTTPPVCCTAANCTQLAAKYVSDVQPVNVTSAPGTNDSFTCNATSFNAFALAPARGTPLVNSYNMTDPASLGCLTFGFNMTVADTVAGPNGTETLTASYTGNYVANIPIPCSVPDVQGWLDTHRLQLQKGLRTVRRKPWAGTAPFNTSQLCADSDAQCPDLATTSGFCTAKNNCTQSCAQCAAKNLDWQLESSLASIVLTSTPICCTAENCTQFASSYVSDIQPVIVAPANLSHTTASNATGFTCNATSYNAFALAPQNGTALVQSYNMTDPQSLGCLTFGFNMTVADTVVGPDGTETLTAAYTGKYVANIPIPCSVPDVQGWLEVHRVALQKELRTVTSKPWNGTAPFTTGQLCADSSAGCADAPVDATFCAANGTICTQSCDNCTAAGYNWQLANSLASIVLTTTPTCCTADNCTTLASLYVSDIRPVLPANATTSNNTSTPSPAQNATSPSPAGPTQNITSPPPPPAPSPSPSPTSRSSVGHTLLRGLVPAAVAAALSLIAALG